MRSAQFPCANNAQGVSKQKYKQNDRLFEVSCYESITTLGATSGRKNLFCSTTCAKAGSLIR